MAIYKKHPYVDNNGFCFLPYLNQWKSEKSNLLELVSSMSVIFR